jgi:hypothetical protein
MIARLREHQAALLSRHFFHALFDFGVLSQEGADSFVRFVIGIIAAVIAFGLLLLRLYSMKYGSFVAAMSAEPYARAVLADTTLVIALPMWIVAFVTVLVSQSLFPDETDFRVLMPLPIDRSVVFGAKLLALALFAGVFTLTAHVALTPLALLMSLNRWAADGAGHSLLAYWIASGCASVFALLAVVAANGLLIACTPRPRVHHASAVLRSTMLGALVLTLPLVLALPTQDLRLAQHSPLMYLAPPAWFLGVERVLLGDRDQFFVQLARVAGLAFLAAGLVTFGSYLQVYRRFDRVMLRSFGVSKRRRCFWPLATSPARAAIRDFTAATLRRSALHQGVAIGLSACGVAIAMNSFLRGGVLTWLQGLGGDGWRIIPVVTGTPFALIFILGIAARAALALPIEPKANWIFRMTEHDAIRSDQLRAAEGIVVLLAVLIPIVLTLPIQWLAAGPRALVSSAITGAFGLLWAEVLLHDWRRIPFTCSYMPGKHTVAQSAVVGIGLFLIISTIGSAIETASIRARTPAPGLTIAVTIAAVAAILRRWRRAHWRQTPLMFDDELPTDVQVFRLSGG